MQKSSEIVGYVNINNTIMFENYSIETDLYPIKDSDNYDIIIYKTSDNDIKDSIIDNQIRRLLEQFHFTHSPIRMNEDTIKSAILNAKLLEKLHNDLETNGYVIAKLSLKGAFCNRFAQIQDREGRIEISLI